MYTVFVSAKTPKRMFATPQNEVFAIVMACVDYVQQHQHQNTHHTFLHRLFFENHENQAFAIFTHFSLSFLSASLRVAHFNSDHINDERWLHSNFLTPSLTCRSPGLRAGLDKLHVPSTSYFSNYAHTISSVDSSLYILLHLAAVSVGAAKNITLPHTRIYTQHCTF